MKLFVLKGFHLFNLLNFNLYIFHLMMAFLILFLLLLRHCIRLIFRFINNCCFNNSYRSVRITMG